MEIITELKRLNNNLKVDLNSTVLPDQPIHMNDETLFEQTKKGNLKSFEMLFRKYYTPLFNYALRYVKQRDDAEEIVQDLFFNIWRNKESIEISTSFQSYVYRSIYNNSIQQLRKKQKSISLDEREQEGKEEGYSEQDAMQFQQLSEKIEEILQQLPERGRKIFVMSRFEGLKYHEIAEKLSISIKTVEANMSKALKTFRKYLREYSNLFLLI